MPGTIYQEAEPAHLAPVEGKLVVQPMIPGRACAPLSASDLGGPKTSGRDSSSDTSERDPFMGVRLPASVTAAVSDHHATVDSILHELSTSSSEEAARITARLAELGLPQAVDACLDADVRLPERLA